MFKTLSCAAMVALSPAALADAPFHDDRAVLQHDRQALAGLRFNLSFGAEAPEMTLQFGAHYHLDGQYEFVPALSFVSRDGFEGLALAGMAAEGDTDGDADERADADGDAKGGGSATLWLVGGGVLVLAAAASGSDSSDEEFCPTGGLALLDLLECIDED